MAMNLATDGKYLIFAQPQMFPDDTL